jgi:hypothetical protein
MSNSNAPSVDDIPDRSRINMPMMTHVFSHAFFHPTKRDILVCMEKDTIPEDNVTYKLLPFKQAAKEEEKNAKLQVKEAEKRVDTTTEIEGLISAEL